MYAATGNATLPARSFLVRLAIRSWEYRHPSVSMAIRLTSALWNMSLGIFLVSHGYVVGLVPLTGSALLCWTAYIVASRTSESRRNGQGDLG